MNSKKILTFSKVKQGDSSLPKTTSIHSSEVIEYLLLDEQHQVIQKNIRVIETKYISAGSSISLHAEYLNYIKQDMQIMSKMLDYADAWVSKHANILKK